MKIPTEQQVKEIIKNNIREFDEVLGGTIFEILN
jgi:hypothetical protein